MPDAASKVWQSVSGDSAIGARSAL